MEQAQSWETKEELIFFPDGKHGRKTWQKYIDSQRLEITGGEARYLVSRYDASTGEIIVPPKRRIGLLDRKLRIVNENTDQYEEWFKWTERAFQSCGVQILRLHQDGVAGRAAHFGRARSGIVLVFFAGYGVLVLRFKKQDGLNGLLRGAMRTDHRVLAAV